MTNFRLFRIERLCRFDENGRKLSKPVEDTVGKRRNCLLQAISSFSHSVFKRLVSQGHQTVSMCGNGLTLLGQGVRGWRKGNSTQ